MCRQTIAAVAMAPSTNNTAESSGLQAATHFKVEWLIIIGDSQLILRQITRQYQIHTTRLKTIHKEIRWHLLRLQHYQVHHTRRSHNTTADALANIAMDTKRSHNYNFTKPDDARWLPPTLHCLMHNDDGYTVTTKPCED
jgi:ribonuclease HI